MAEDHTALHRLFLELAGETRCIAHRTDLTELVSISLALLEISNIHLLASTELARKEHMMRLRNLGIFIVVMVVLLLGVMVVMAQDAPIPALPPTTETPQDILGIVLAALFGGAVTIGGSLIVTAIVGILKAVIPASVASGDTLKNITSVVVWLLYSLAIKFGLGTQFQNVAAVLAPILTTALPLIGVLIGSAKLYLASKEHNVPILGYQRT